MRGLCLAGAASLQISLPPQGLPTRVRSAHAWPPGWQQQQQLGLQGRVEEEGHPHHPLQPLLPVSPRRQPCLAAVPPSTSVAVAAACPSLQRRLPLPQAACCRPRPSATKTLEPLSTKTPGPIPTKTLEPLSTKTLSTKTLEPLPSSSHPPSLPRLGPQAGQAPVSGWWRTA